MKKGHRNERSIQKRILLFAAGTLLPLFFFLNYYNNNPQYFLGSNYILFEALLCVVGAGVYYILMHFFDCSFSLLIAVALWIVFWLYPSFATSYPIAVFWLVLLLGVFVIVIISGAFLHFLNIRKSTSLIIACMWLLLFIFYPQLQVNHSEGLFWFLFFLIVYFVLKMVNRHPFDKTTEAIFGIVIITLVVYNAINAVIINQRGLSSASDKKQYTTIDNVLLDSSDRHPNIYWLHMDGMMSFSEIEKLLGDDQVILKQQLLERNFTINEGASLDVGWTGYAIPSLTCPSTYDIKLKPMFDNLQGMTDTERRESIADWKSIYDLFPNLELFRAFKSAGYKTFYCIQNISRGLEESVEGFDYDDAFSGSRNVKLLELLLNQSALRIFRSQLYGFVIQMNGYPNSSNRSFYHSRIFDYVNPDSNVFDCTGMICHYDWFIADANETILENKNPKMVYLQNLIPHFPYQYDEEGISIGQIKSNHDVDSYLPQHQYAAKVMMGMVDRIIEDDPNAIIVIQGDHGIHDFSREEMYNQGFNDEQMIEMNYSTISAVRIPENYGTLSEPLDPLDITRYLVNHFVGEGNYDYLYYKGE